MPPFGPKLKNDGPACRVCGCTEHNACLVESPCGFVPCSWVRLGRGLDARLPLCSHCAGTAEDLIDAIDTAIECTEEYAMPALKGAARRYRLRIKREFGLIRP